MFVKLLVIGFLVYCLLMVLLTIGEERPKDYGNPINDEDDE